MNTQDFISPLLQAHADKPALICHDRQITYESLYTKVSHMACALAGNFQPGTLLALWLPNCQELICLYLACLKSGIIPMPMHKGMKWPEVRNVLDYSRAKYLITSQRFIDSHIVDIADTDLRQTYVIESGRLQKPYSSCDELINNTGRSSEPCIAAESLALVLLTSGSSGQPKAVKLSHVNLHHILEYRLTHTQLTPGSISIVGSCLTQSVGLYQSLALLAAGATLVLLESYDIDLMAEYVNRYKPTHLIMTVNAFDRLLHHPDINRNSLCDITFAATGADRVTPRLQNRFIALKGKPLWTTYGLTESSWALVNTGDRMDKCLSLGKPCGGIETKLMDPDGREVPLDTVGEIYIRSPRTMSGYLHDEELTRNTIINGWLASGDLAYKDVDDYYWFAGRKKNIIVLNTGDNVSPAEVENIILSHPDITNCIVVGNRGHNGSDEPWAFVTCRDKKLSEETMKVFLHERLSSYKIPRRIVFLSDLPAGLTGKVCNPVD